MQLSDNSIGWGTSKLNLAQPLRDTSNTSTKIRIVHPVSAGDKYIPLDLWGPSRGKWPCRSSNGLRPDSRSGCGRLQFARTEGPVPSVMVALSHNPVDSKPVRYKA